MTRRTYAEYQDNPDDENRTFYVAATRARKTLTWIADGSQGFKL
jgi:superfamily I DNA/RNA helicase